jgi:hypothetical protein
MSRDKKNGGTLWSRRELQPLGRRCMSYPFENEFEKAPNVHNGKCHKRQDDDPQDHHWKIVEPPKHTEHGDKEDYTRDSSFYNIGDRGYNNVRKFHKSSKVCIPEYPPQTKG